MRQHLRLKLVCFFFGTRFFTIFFAEATTTTAGGGGAALKFDGKNDIAQIISTTSLCSNVPGINRFEFEEFTIEFWYYRKKSGVGGEHIFGLKSGEGVHLVEWHSGSLKFRIDKTSHASNAVVGGCRDSQYVHQKSPKDYAWAVSTQY